MSEQETIPEPIPARGVDPPAGNSYPADLALFVHDRWRGAAESPGADLLPDAATLERFFSACYHASMLREEERPVTFRVILAPAEHFPPQGRPPEGLQRLDFSRTLPFHPSELRRLSVATDSQRTLIGAQRDADGELRIWGLIHSGSRWLREVQGGRRAGAALPLAPVVYVAAPGSMEVYKGYELVGKIEGGRLSGSRIDLFKSDWLKEQFSRFRGDILEQHEAARSKALEESGERWASLDPTLARTIAGRMMKRVIAVVSAARHGGTIVFIPLDDSDDSSVVDDYIDLKYKLDDKSFCFCFPELVVDILNRLARIHGDSERPAGWREFETVVDEEIAAFDETLFEIAHMIAGLAAVDGVVALSKNHEILGFGGMISTKLPAVRSVARALDIEGEKVAVEETWNVGTRHNSAYRLAGALPGSVAIVISQDGGVRFVCQKDGRVAYWEQE